jgi:hypothetical protein
MPRVINFSGLQFYIDEIRLLFFLDLGPSKKEKFKFAT